MTIKKTDPLKAAIDQIGLQPAGKLCNVSWQAVAKWLKEGLPRSEWTGETKYAEILAKATNGKVKKKAILEFHNAKRRLKSRSNG